LRCLTCQSLSFKIICKDCQRTLLQPSFYKREVTKDFYVYSFYKMDEVKELINSKYQFYGDRVFKIIAQISFKKFASNFEYSSDIFAVAIDDHTRHEFSHTAILAKELNSKNITALNNILTAQNIVKYAGQDLAFRKKNKRDFFCKNCKNKQVILVDDIVTTGSTMLEAKEILEKNNCEVLFGLCISDANI